ncbi:MAG TPA: TonB-dependent receptor [Steroidobacteraceae bacterium]|jgi:outer membrane receptor protein involved in Fe transport|nr:TonB-dependent receptor [Steroidobacteraceae bacterium]
MRITLTLVALLPLAASAADEPAPTTSEAMDDSGAQDIVVTATRDRRSAFQTPASITRIDHETIEAVGSKHQADVLNRNAGVYIQRGSGAESLGAIRSPVLAGAGACGSFLVAEDSLPIRPVGFCNLNEMFELNYEQAGQIEVLRGPGSSMFGASAVHGVVNLLTPRVPSLPDYSLGFEGGSDSFKRLSISGKHLFAGADDGIGVYGVATRAPGWRDASGVDEAKLNLLGDVAVGGGHLRVRAAGSVLNQETAGFIQGHNSYRDEATAHTNPNPEAFRDASSARLSAHYDERDVFGRGSDFEIAGIYRRSRMDFLQHFLIGKPLEHNAQTSVMVSGIASIPIGKFSTRIVLDAEKASSELTEFQSGPATDGAPAANAIRPAGFHYDYTVNSWTLGGTLALEYRISERFTATAALRADETNYDYDNHMIDGNTRADGTLCGGGGCLYSRPADRTDRFDNLSPSLTLAWQPTLHHLLYVNASSGFRPPEMTEVYRLQRQQSVADLNSESLDSVELGWKYHVESLSLNAAFYDMKKRDVILRETNGFNVSNGATRHRGFEYEARFDTWRWNLSLNGSFARHQYAFSRAIEGGETIVSGNDIDTAPRNLHTLAFDLKLGQSGAWRLGTDVVYVGKYFLDAANTATYPGHTVANGRLMWNAAKDLRAALRIDNLFDKRYADRADFAFGDYRYFPARGRAVFLSIDYASN